jgi:transcriptional regulator with PAS, ATPase and Fis domain
LLANIDYLQFDMLKDQGCTRKKENAIMFDLPYEKQIKTQNPKLRHLLDSLPRIAATSSSVCITGESGTGKELIARKIHSLSPQSSQDFIAINCASIPDGLIESELFGHKKGSFTGASVDHKGLFEAANDGTLFLDEVADMPMLLQAKLLRVLQEKKIRRLGSSLETTTNFRLITATHRNLKELVKKKFFREDLYYRINVVSLSVPSLRERKEDIPMLVSTFLEHCRRKAGFAELSITDEAIADIRERPWPGNIRELENFIERVAALHSKPGAVELSDLPREESDAATPLPELFKSRWRENLPTVTALSSEYIRYVLTIAKSYDEAAKILGINRRTIYRKLRLASPNPAFTK